VTEKFAFEQRLRYGRAVDRDEGRTSARAHLINCPSQQLLSGAALTQQQDRDIGGGDLLNVAQDLQHFRAARNDAVDRRYCSGVHKPAIFGFELEHLPGTADDQSQDIDIDGFLVKVIGAQRNGSQCMFARLVACCDNDFCRRCDGKDLGEGGQAFGGSVRIGRET
jgi:hypothetical protein